MEFWLKTGIPLNEKQQLTLQVVGTLICSEKNNKNMEERMVGVMTLGELISFSPLLTVGHHQCNFQWTHFTPQDSESQFVMNYTLWLASMFQIKREINHRKRKQVPCAEQNSVCVKQYKFLYTHYVQKVSYWYHHFIQCYYTNLELPTHNCSNTGGTNESHMMNQSGRSIEMASNLK